jgi:hypothetical protein
MKTLKVKYEVPGTDVTSVAVKPKGTKGKPQEMVRSGNEFTIKLDPGKYVLLWRAKGGQPSTAYTIEITAPKEAVWAPDPPKRTTPNGNVAAQHTFTINA